MRSGEPFDLQFLADISYVSADLHFAAVSALDFPPFGGSALRGAFGHAFRRHLCAARMKCEDGCVQQESCSYFNLFVRERAGIGQGESIPKPYILEPPAPKELEVLAYGGAVHSPYKASTDGNGLPVLHSDFCARISAGVGVSVRLTLLGEWTHLLTPVIALLARSPLHIGGGELALVRADDVVTGAPLLDVHLAEMPIQEPLRQTLRALLQQPECGSSRLQVAFVTPVRLRAGGEYCFDAEALARHLWQAALTRAMRIRDFLCCPDKPRLPFMDLPAELPRLAGHRLYHYALRRLSHRQRQFMDFDGVVGSLYLEGELEELTPLVRAVQFLHLGQKATFGLGQIRSLFLR